MVLRPPSSCLGSNIAMAYVDNEYIKNGTQLQVLKHCQCIILYCTLVLLITLSYRTFISFPFKKCN